MLGRSIYSHVETICISTSFYLKERFALIKVDYYHHFLSKCIYHVSGHVYVCVDHYFPSISAVFFVRFCNWSDHFYFHFILFLVCDFSYLVY